MLEEGEFVMNRNAVQDIGVENLEAANSSSPRYAQEGGLQEQNSMKLRRAKEMAPKSPQFVGNMSNQAFLDSDYIAGQNRRQKHQFETMPTYRKFAYNQWLHFHSPMAKEKQKADQVLHDANQLKYGHNPFKGTMSMTPPPPPPPPPMGNVFTPASEQIKSKYVSGMPTQETLGATPSKGSSANMDKKTPSDRIAQRARWDERNRMIFESKRQPNPKDVISASDMSSQPRGSEAQQLGSLLDQYRVADGGMTFDDFKMDHPIAYETLKKNYSMAFHDMQGDMPAFEYAGERAKEDEALRKKEMQPHYDFIANDQARIREEGAEADFFAKEKAKEKWEADTQKSMSKIANFGLVGWEKGIPRIAVQDMVNNFGSNNTVEQQWVNGEYDDNQRDQYTLKGGEITGIAQQYFDTVMNREQSEAGTRHIEPKELKERAQNLRHLVNTVTEEKGFYSEKNPTGISPEQLSEMNSMIDDSYNFAMQGYQTPREVENQRKQTEMAAKARQEAIDNMEQKTEKKSKPSRLAEFAGSLLFGQKGGAVAMQEGGSVSLNNSRRLFNLARRKYA